jgi:hypothetical protein
MEFLKKLLSNNWFRYCVIFGIGVTIGCVFYPAKRVDETLKKEYEQRIAKVVEEKETLSKDLTEKYSKLSGEYSSYKVETSTKMSSLTVQVKELQAKKKETYYQIVHPDGTIETKKYTESEVNESNQIISEVKLEFAQKVTEIEHKWESIHSERVLALKKDYNKRESVYQETIKKMEYEKITETNMKRHDLELGMLSDRSYYTHIGMDVWGPMFVGVQAQSNFSDAFRVGAGVGVRF